MEQYVRAKGTINNAWDKEIDIKAVIGMVVSRGVCDFEDIVALNDFIGEQKKEKKELDKFAQIIKKIDVLTELIKDTQEKNELLKKDIDGLAVDFSETKEKIENIEEWISEIERKKDIKEKGEEDGKEEGDKTDKNNTGEERK